MENSNELKSCFKNPEKGMQSTLDWCFGDSPSQGLLHDWETGSLGEKWDPYLLGLLERALSPVFPIEDENRPISQHVVV